MSCRASFHTNFLHPNLSLLYPARHTSNKSFIKRGKALINYRIAGEKRDLAEALKALDAVCRKCVPVTPLECITRCDVWRLKNELRKLRGVMEKPNFMKELLNTLKNETRLQILKTIANEGYSADKLDHNFREVGRMDGKNTIYEECLQPLAAVGLVAENMNQRFYATVFGCILAKRLDGFADLIRFLPANSECYEETLLTTLLQGPKTFKNLASLVSPNIAPRILKRLKTAGLIETPEDKDYVFFFRSKRDPAKETLSNAERKVYNAISECGISARQLSEKTGISPRRIYLHLRRLKGKKLVFVRRTPKTYRLTAKGLKLASLLRELQALVEEIWKSSEQLDNSENT